MNLREVYEKFDAIGCLTFSTVEDGRPETRIAHFFAYDEDGLYLRTMITKPFYRQLKHSAYVAACGMYPTSQVQHDENNLPYFKPGYSMRVTGHVRELSMEELEEKAKDDRNFNVAVFDVKKYPATRIFLMDSGVAECYDFDYAKENRDHKLERERFAWGGAEAEKPGLTISDACISCGSCVSVCTFDAIHKTKDDRQYEIWGNRCDECGNCFNVCPVGAVIGKGE